MKNIFERDRKVVREFLGRFTGVVSDEIINYFHLLSIKIGLSNRPNKEIIQIELDYYVNEFFTTCTTLVPYYHLEYYSEFCMNNLYNCETILTDPNYFLYPPAEIIFTDGHPNPYTKEQGKIINILFELYQVFFDKSVSQSEFDKLKKALTLDQVGIDSDIEEWEPVLSKTRILIKLIGSCYWIFVLKGLLTLNEFDFYNLYQNRFFGAEFKEYSKDLKSNLTLDSKLSNKQIKYLCDNINSWQIFEKNMDAKIFEELLKGVHQKPIKVINNQKCAHFFNTLHLTGWINNNWQDVIHKNKSFLGNRGAYLTNKNLSSSLANINRNDKIIKGITSIIESL